jgi:uncharacterized membrane protein
MPYCHSCGKEVHDRDIYCAKCGTPQPHQATAAPPQPIDPLHSMSPRTASILCYVPVIGWIAAVVVLASRRFRLDGTVRFHAFQGLYLFATWLVVNWALRPLFHVIGNHMYRLDSILEAVLFVAAIIMIIKTSQNEVYSLPILGELAHRSATET